MADDRLFDEFLQFSSAVTGFGTFRLRGTGQAEPYFATVSDMAGRDTIRELLDAYQRIVRESGSDEAAFERTFRRDVMSHEKLGPVTRNIIKLWYVGTWYELPREWRETYGGNADDRTFVVSPTAYTEGLLWPAIGANPSGAKPLGYGTWAMPPRIEPEV